MPALLAFEAASRLASFRAAADELDVTPGAISQHIKTLEHELRATLFHRRPRGVVPTADGLALQRALERGLSEVSMALERVRDGGETRPVSVAATTAMSSLWLTPRLGRFWKSHGGIAVDQIVSDSPPARHQEHDLEIRYAKPGEHDGYSRALFQDTLVPVCSAAFAARLTDTRPDALAHVALIHLESNARWTDWRDWFDAVGCTEPLSRGMRVNNYTIAVQAARDDLGLLLGWRTLLTPLLERGLLVEIGTRTLPAPAGFHLYTPDGAAPREAAELLADWLVASV